MSSIWQPTQVKWRGLGSGNSDACEGGLCGGGGPLGPWDPGEGEEHSYPYSTRGHGSHSWTQHSGSDWHLATLGVNQQKRPRNQMTIWDFVVGKKMPLGFLKADRNLRSMAFPAWALSTVHHLYPMILLVGFILSDPAWGVPSSSKHSSLAHVIWLSP